MMGLVRRVAALAAAGAAVALFLASPAAAGTYQIQACNAGDGTGTNNAFSPSTYGRGEAFDGCAPGVGLRTQVAGWGATTYYPEGAYFQLCPPSGTRIVGYSANATVHYQGSGYDRRIDTGSCGGYQYLAGGELPPSIDNGDVGRYGYGLDVDIGGLRLTTTCGTALGCTGNYAYTTWDYLRVTIRDETAPQIDGVYGLLGQPGWVRGSHSIDWASSDNVGLRRFEAEIVRPGDGQRVWSWAHDKPCDYSRPVPCPTPAAASTGAAAPALDTASLPDGGYRAQVSAQDAAQNWAQASYNVNLDNSPPVAALSRAAGTYGRGVAWTVADRMSGVNGASLVAEYLDSGTWREMTGGSWDGGTYNATVPASVPDGQVTVRLAGADNAAPGGNAFNTGGATVTVDGAAPSPPTLSSPGRWLSGGDPDYYEVQLGTPAPLPASGIAGYSVTRDGGDPDVTVDIAEGAKYMLDGLAEGTTVVKARTVSGAGLVSGVRQSVVRVDRTSPTVQLLGAGDPLTPHPGPITVHVAARDALSGMSAADPGEPIERGGYVAYRLDGGQLTTTAGDEADVAVAASGAHALTYYAVDVAGNASEAQSRSVTIEPSGPTDRDHRVFWNLTANPRTTFTAATRFGAPCPDQASIEANRDAMVDESQPSANLGDADTAIVRSGAGVSARMLVGFPLPAAPDCEVASAQLQLTWTDWLAGRQIDVLRAGAAWGETTVTWATRPGGVGAPASAVVAAGDTQVWDVTAQVQALYRNGDNGLVIRDHAEGQSGMQGYRTREGSSPASRPRLIVRFNP